MYELKLTAELTKVNGKMDQIRIFDTTLRDGEQAPGASLTVAEKIKVARQLVLLNVDIIEAGFPASSPGEFEAVSTIARETHGVAVAALARCKDGDPQRAVEALRAAEQAQLHVFIASSDIHLKHKLHLTRDEALAATEKWVRYGRQALGPDAKIEFSAEDATRTEVEFLLRMYEVAVGAGATILNIPDTVGYAIPAEFGRLVAEVVKRFGRVATISVHCHNDLGLATANTLTALQNGARQLEVCVNGLGERAGNASLEEVVMGIKTRGGQFGQLDTRVITEQITPASQLVSYLTGFAVQPNKAIVGANAFAHESGIHQDGVIKNPLTYEIMTPQSVGLSGSQLTIGKLSGRRGLKEKLHTLGFEVEGEALNEIYQRVIALADTKKEITDGDLVALFEEKTSAKPESICLGDWTISSGNNQQAMGRVALTIQDQVCARAAVGNGPVDALYAAIDQCVENVLGWRPTLVEYEIKAVSAGEDAQGQVTVRLKRPEQAAIVTGHGLSTDIIKASIQAYLAGIEKLLD